MSSGCPSVCACIRACSGADIQFLNTIYVTIQLLIKIFISSDKWTECYAPKSVTLAATCLELAVEKWRCTGRILAVWRPPGCILPSSALRPSCALPTHLLPFSSIQTVLQNIEKIAFSSMCREVVHLQEHIGWRMEKFKMHQDINGVHLSK